VVGHLPLGEGSMMDSFIQSPVPMSASGGKFCDSKDAMEALSILEQRLPRIRRSLKKMQTSGLGEGRSEGAWLRVDKGLARLPAWRRGRVQAVGARARNHDRHR
jgi:hypothetical protein